MVKKITKHFLVLCAVLFSSAVFAAAAPASTNNEFYLPFSKFGHLVLQLGAYQGIQGEQQHINIESLIGDTFTVDDQHDTNGLVGLGYYLNGPTWGRIKTSFGVNAFYLAKMSVSGDVIQENYFDNLSYSYSVKDYPIYAMAKSIINLNSAKYALTFDAGIGPNFIQATNFQEKSKDGVTLPDDPFSSHTATALSETVGIGVRINDVFGRLPLEIGYRFFYLGQGRFSTNNNQVLDTLTTGKTYANAIICSISF
jgi:hypothetical protein